MASKQQGEQRTESEQPPRDERKAVIGKHVMHTLGQPRDLHKVEVRRLWGDYYRVNVLTGPDAASIRIANSFFLEVDGGGNIVEATPKITMQY